MYFVYISIYTYTYTYTHSMIRKDRSAMAVRSSKHPKLDAGIQRRIGHIGSPLQRSVQSERRSVLSLRLGVRARVRNSDVLQRRTRP